MVDQYDIYLAGPFFNDEQVKKIELVEKLSSFLKLKVFSPRKIGELEPSASLEERENVFSKDIDAILRSKYVFAITNDKDMGTLFECGFAYANDIKVVYICLGLKGGFNTMLAQSGVAVLTSENEVNRALTYLSMTGSVPFDVYEGDVE